MSTSYLAPTDLSSARSRISDEVASRHANSGSQVVSVSSSSSFQQVSAAVESVPVCLVVDFVLWQWEPGHFRSLQSLLGSGSDLYFLEPVATYGFRRALHRLGRSYFMSKDGHHYETDVPDLLRRGGFALNTVDRFDVGFSSYAWGHVFCD